MSHSIGIMEVFNIGLRGQKVTTDNRLGEIRKNTFGTEMKIIAYRKNSDIDIQFLDDNGYVYEHQTYSNFKAGQIKNPYDRTIFGVGYIGVGKYKTGLRKRNPEQYVWRGMLERCYGDKYKDVHSAYYNKCYVCDEWLNFQVFAEWYNENIYQIGTERMHLDKDILIKGNKVYSPDTCLIVPQSINEIFHVSGKKTKDIDLPYTILRTSKEKYSVSFRGKSLGVYDTVDKALDTYLKAKKNYIRQKVKEMENELPTKVRDALLAW